MHKQLERSLFFGLVLAVGGQVHFDLMQEAVGANIELERCFVYCRGIEIAALRGAYSLERFDYSILVARIYITVLAVERFRPRFGKVTGIETGLAKGVEHR